MFANERKGRKQRSSIEVGCCPVCGVTIRSGDYDSHLVQELEKLVRLPQSRPLSQRMPSHTDASLPSTSSSPEASTSSGVVRLRRPRRKGSDWTKYESIRDNRLSRARQKRRAGESGDTFEGSDMQRDCPVCDKPFPLSELQRHTQRCLRQAEAEFEDEEIDIEGDEDEVGMLEEYEWCGVTRVRATTLLQAEGQLHAIGTTVMKGSEDEMVDVCDDEDNGFGPSQYTDKDFLVGSDKNNRRDNFYNPAQNNNYSCEIENQIHVSSSSLYNNDAHTTHSQSTIFPARFEIENSRNPPSHGHNSRPEIEPTEAESYNSLGKDEDSVEISRFESKNVHVERSIVMMKEHVGDGNAVIEALRVKVRELEQECQRDRVSCRVCHGEYETPVVSISCWHVHCETCWLQALAAKKLCPQCSAITTSSDLRRIYL